MKSTPYPVQVRRPPYPVHVRRVPRTWWLRSGPYRRFAARELTSGFALVFCLFLLLFLYSLSQGRQDYERFLGWLQEPIMVALSALFLAALLYHTFTWFRLTTRILMIRLGRTHVHPNAVMGLLIVAWLGASAVVAYFHVWF